MDIGYFYVNNPLHTELKDTAGKLHQIGAEILVLRDSRATIIGGIGVLVSEQSNAQYPGATI